MLFRDPVQRAISQYWHSVRLKAEDQPLAMALSLEDERLAGQDDIVAAGGESFAHRNFSYKARGHYAEQLRRWFEVIERERILVMESEELWARPRRARPCPAVAGVGEPRRGLSLHQRRAAGPTRRRSGHRRLAPALHPLRRGPVRAVGPAALGALTPGNPSARAWTAAHMASTGAARPVHRSRARAAWCTSIPSPPTVTAPRASAAASSGVTRGW